MIPSATAPKRCIDAQDSKNAIAFGDRDMTHPAIVVWPGKECIETHFSWSQNHVGLHHLFGAANQKHICM